MENKKERDNLWNIMEGLPPIAQELVHLREEIPMLKPDAKEATEVLMGIEEIPEVAKFKKREQQFGEACDKLGKIIEKLIWVHGECTRTVRELIRVNDYLKNLHKEVVLMNHVVRALTVKVEKLVEGK